VTSRPDGELAEWMDTKHHIDLQKVEFLCGQRPCLVQCNGRWIVKDTVEVE
jgi:hypothetical protein